MRRHLVPHFIVDKYAAGERSGRFSGVVLFVDTSGFTPLTAQLEQYATAGAETLANVLLAVFEPLIEAVYAHGGFVAGFAGDAFKAVFPGLEREPYLAALATAHAVQKHMAEHALYMTPYGEFPFAVRASIADGEIEWGIWQAATSLAESQTALYSFGGAALDEAIRGEALAMAGDIIMTEAVLTAVGKAAGLTAEPLADASRYWRITDLTAVRSETPLAVFPEQVPPSAVAPFYPPTLVTRASQGEFRRVLTLFINLQTLPSTAEKDDFASTLFRLLEQYEGYICRLGRIGALDAGGTLLLFWGAPTSHENDVERVLNFILDFQAQTAVPCRAGITYQIAYAGFIGSPRREEYTCYGLGVNLAARLMTGAPWGAVWVDDAVAQRAKTQFRLSYQDERPFKGFSQPQPVYQLLRRRAMMSTLFFQKQMVGRQYELLQLAAMLAPVQNGRFGGVVTISGEAGIGKSHLVQECLIKIDFLDRGELFFCQSDEILRESLNPFRYFLRHYFEQTNLAGEEDNKTRFDTIFNDLIEQTVMEELRAELERTRSFLGALIDLHWEDSLYAQTEPKLRQENTFIALKTLIKAESLRQPLVLQIEDTHWLDDNSRQFLLELTRNVSTFPFIVLMTTRQTQRTVTFPDNIPQRLIDLKPLDETAVMDLAQTVLRDAVSPELVRLLVERTDGNPFFVEQVTIYLREQKLLQSTEMGLKSQEAVSTLPNDLQAILVARIDQLTQEVRQVVQTAAVLGREFDVQVLSQMLRGEATLLDKVKMAESAAIWSALSELRYLFKHALLRDAAYHMQLQNQRHQLHSIAAKAIHQLHVNNLAPYYADLVYHYRHAELKEQERYFARLAGEAAADQFANKQALDYLSRALALTTDPIERFPLLKARIKVYTTLAQRDKERADIEELRQLANTITDEAQPYRQAQAALAQTMLSEGIGEYASAEKEAAAAVRFAQLAGDSETETDSRLRWIIALWWQGRYDEAKEQASVMLSVAQTESLPIAEAHALLQLGNIAFLEEIHAEAQQYYQQALSIYQQQNHAVGEAPALSNLGLVAKHTDPEQAKEYFEQALLINRQIGDRRGIAHSLSSLAGLDTDKGNYEAALSQIEVILPLVREIDDRNGELYCFTLLVSIYTRLGDYATAEKYSLEERQLCEALDNLRSKCLSLTKYGFLLYLQDNYEEAAAIQQEAVALAEAIGLAQLKANPLIYLGHALAGLGQLTQAREAYDEALDLMDTLGKPQNYMELRAGLTRLALMQNDLTSAYEQVEMILTLLADHPLNGANEPVQIYLTCYEVLAAQGDQKAAEVLEAGYSFLQQQASAITDEKRRQQFLTGVTAHHKLIEIYTTRLT